MSRTLFVTGTDTGVGKTRVACALIRRARRQGLRVAAFKPVASGAVITTQGLRNEDAEALIVAAGGRLSYADVNPVCLAPPIAPHLAARAAGKQIDLASLDEAHDRLAAHHDLVIVEGAGGWQVPLNVTDTFADWVGRRGWPVVLVVAMRLGCLNHALLSVESIGARTRLAGWIANRVPPLMSAVDENEDDLRARIGAPCWGSFAPGAQDWPGEAGACEEWMRGSGLN